MMGKQGVFGCFFSSATEGQLSTIITDAMIAVDSGSNVQKHFDPIDGPDVSIYCRIFAVQLPTTD